jgi:hypothetical protein
LPPRSSAHTAVRRIRDDHVDDPGRLPRRQDDLLLRVLLVVYLVRGDQHNTIAADIEIGPVGPVDAGQPESDHVRSRRAAEGQHAGKVLDVAPGVEAQERPRQQRRHLGHVLGQDRKAEPVAG